MVNKYLLISILACTFVKDQATDSYERSVFGVLDLTGNLGGLFEVLSILGSFVVGFFADRIFLYTFLSKLYHIDNAEKSKIW